MIRTPAGSARRETRVLGSRFIAEASPIADEAAAGRLRTSLRQEFPDATHHCFGLSLRTRLGERTLADDDGEPGGTAGAPILQAIRRAGVTNALVVVVRYFGGTRLGKGGLARAYREAAGLALAAAGMVERVPDLRLRLSGPLGLDGEVRHLVARHAGRVVEGLYGDGDPVVLLVVLPEPALPRLEEDLGRVTRGTWSLSGWEAQDQGRPDAPVRD